VSVRNASAIVAAIAPDCAFIALGLGETKCP